MQLEQLLQLGSQALRKAALSQGAKQYVLSNPTLFKTLKKAADRYIGGESLEETVVKVKEQNQQDIKCSIEFMGENTSTEQEAIEATEEFIRVCDAIKKEQLRSIVSLDLSHIGLAISKELCVNNLDEICLAASQASTEVMISAEGHEFTSSVLDAYKKIVKIHLNVGITLQAYLHRTSEDFEEVIKERGKVRLVKGAFETPQGISLPRGEELNSRYLEYVERLLSCHHPCSIATHDQLIQVEAKKCIDRHRPPKDRYEFESLFGIAHKQLIGLKKEGYPIRLYFVYGQEWYLYVCNRIAEYPLNLFRALDDIVG